MSRHFFNTFIGNEIVTILMGYDRPLDGFFMVIFLENLDDECLYTNLSEAEPHPKNLNRYREP